MSDSGKAIQLDARDNVATALSALPAGAAVNIGAASVKLACDIPRGHKFALRLIPKGHTALKYGQPIGRATRDIAPGEHVHVHNLQSQRAAREEGAGG